MGTENFVNECKIFVSRQCEHQIRLMNVYEEDNFFHTTFIKAGQAITGIVGRTIRYHGEDGTLKNVSKTFDLMNYPNNIVSFCAQRGQGKSSAMFSMADALRKINVTENSSYNESRNKFWERSDVNLLSGQQINPVLKSHFELLDPIDPTIMEPKDSIVRIIISKMFRAVNDKFDSRIKNPHSTLDERKLNSQKEELVQKFLECYRGLDYLNTDKSNLSTSSAFDDLYRLAELGDSVNFKCAFFELVTLYLEFMAGKDENAFLVIQVDDADVNTQYAYEITEELRKYCVLPNVIILMAMHMHTMNNAIEQHFIERYNTLVKFKHHYLDIDRCHEIMEKYIDKFIPTTHRVHIPSINTSIQNEYTKLELLYVDTEDSTEDLIHIDDKLWHDDCITNNYQDKLIMLIYQKTGILLVKPNGYLHDFLPQNLRELAHFLPHITNMEDVIRVDDKTGEVTGTFEHILKLCGQAVDDSSIIPIARLEIDRVLKNLKELESYLLRNWSQMHLSSKQYDVIDKIHLAQPSLKNRRVTELLHKYPIERNKGEYENIETREQHGIGYVPYSDVVFALYNLQHVEDPKDEYPFACAIKIYYTLYLHQVALVGLKNWLNDTSMMKSETPFRELVDIIGYRIFPEKYYGRVESFKSFNKKDNGDERFKRVKEYTENFSTDVINHFLHWAYEVKIEDETKIFSLYNKDPRSSPNSPEEANEFVCFDPFRPIVSLLGAGDIYTKFLDPEIGLYSLIADFLRIICNVDIQEMLYHKYFKSTTHTDTNPMDFIDNACDFVPGVYTQVDDAINQALLMSQKSDIRTKMFSSGVGTDPTLFSSDDFKKTASLKQTAPDNKADNSDDSQTDNNMSE